MATSKNDELLAELRAKFSLAVADFQARNILVVANDNAFLFFINGFRMGLRAGSEIWEQEFERQHGHRR